MIFNISGGQGRVAVRQSPRGLLAFSERGTSALHLNEPTWIIDGFYELIVDFLFAL